MESSTEARGSLRWIREFVNDRPRMLDRAIDEASEGRLTTPVTWRSPLASDGYKEYWDRAFLDLIGVELAKRPLGDFWPRGGPHWDGLGLSDSGEPILVEAKANIAEVISSPSGAVADASKDSIAAALEETAEFLGATSTCDWSGTFYQYANRLAHLYLFREVNNIPAWLVSIYFIGDRDVRGPETEAEWRAAIQVLEGALGIRGHALLRYKLDVFVHVEDAR
jgi:hypothetical protein